MFKVKITGIGMLIIYIGFGGELRHHRPYPSHLNSEDEGSTFLINVTM
jgi:hypothetical protein